MSSFLSYGSFFSIFIWGTLDAVPTKCWARIYFKVNHCYLFSIFLLITNNIYFKQICICIIVECMVHYDK